MFSLNVPVPAEVSALAAELRSALLPAAQLRDELTLVVKRLPADSWDEFVEVERDVRRTTADQPPMAARIDGVATFEDPPAGAAPVLYLPVESPGLVALHARLVERFGAAGGIEGDGYVPHITLARGPGSDEAAALVRDADVPSIEWTVDQLVFWDGRRDLAIGDVTLGESQR